MTLKYNQSYTFDMKTAVSLPNDLFESAEVLAEELGFTRSELYARAVDDYVRKHRKSEIKKRLKAFYGQDVPSDAAVTLYARTILERSEW